MQSPQATKYFIQHFRICSSSPQDRTETVSPHLKQPGDEDCEANGLHDVGVVLQQCLATPFHPQVQHLCLVLIVEVGGVVGDLIMNAGPGRVGVAAAEGDSVHQVFPLNVTSQSARKQEKRGRSSGFFKNSFCG